MALRGNGVGCMSVRMAPLRRVASIDGSKKSAERSTQRGRWHCARVVILGTLGSGPEAFQGRGLAGHFDWIGRDAHESNITARTHMIG